MLWQDLSFCIVGYSPDNWRSELTHSNIDYYRHSLGGPLFCAEDVNAALEACQTDYLLIQRPGSLILLPTFFTDLKEMAERLPQTFIGEIVLAEDYAYISDNLLFFNMKVWRDRGGVKFNDRPPAETPMFNAVDWHENYTPVEITKGEFFNQPSKDCIQKGAALLIHELIEFNKVEAFPKDLWKNRFFLKTDNLYNQFICESQLETVEMARINKFIDIFPEYSFSDLPQCAFDIAIVPANGLYAHDFIRAANVQKVIIFGTCQEQLELQRMIFSIRKPSNYENIINGFLYKNPTVQIIGNPKLGRNVILQPCAVEIEYVQLQPASFQFIELLKSLDIRSSVGVCIHNVFTNPLLNYKQSRETMHAFFEGVCRAASSRPAPAFIHGLDPYLNVLNMVRADFKKQQDEAKDPEAGDETTV